MKKDEILAALKWRYAVKVFDQNKKVSQEDVQTILEAGRLAPSSSGTEPWKFILVENPEIRKQMRGEKGQPKITDASHLIVIGRRTDALSLAPELIARTGKTQAKTAEELSGLKKSVDAGVSKKTTEGTIDGWLAAQTYIPLGIMVMTAALLGVDAGPMEGFDPMKINEILGLSAKNLSAVTMLALGYRGDDKYAALPKTRRPFDEVVEIVS